MKENLHNIDKLFKNALEKFEDSPSSEVWKNIDKNLDKKSVVSISKKYYQLKWVASFLLIFSISMAMYILQGNKKDKILLKKNQVQVSIKDQKNEINDEKNDHKELTGNNKTVMPKKVRPGEMISQDNSPINKVSNQTNTIEKNNIKLSKSLSTNQALSNKYAQSDQAGKSSNYNSEGKNLKATESVYGDNNEVNNSKSESTNNVDKLINNNDITVVNSDLFTQSLQTRNKLLMSVPLSDQEIISTKTIPLNSLKIENPNVFNLKNIQARTHISIPSKRPSFYATIFFSPDIARYNIENDHPQFEEDTKDQIKKNEKPQLANSYGILIGYQINRNWIIQSGMMISNSVTSIDSKTVYARPDRNGNIDFRLSCFTGPSYIPLKSGAHPTFGDSTTLSAKNTLQYIGIPIILQYRISTGRLSINPGVGIGTNFLVLNKIESSINTASGVQKSMNNSNGLRSAYFNSVINLNTTYKLTNRIGLSFTPGARFGLTSITKDAPGKTVINSFGFEAGLNIEL